MKVFTSKEFIEKLKWLVNDVPNYYHSENDSWCRYNWNNNKFMMDCVVSIKGLLWGFAADKNLPHGGGVYLSNGVADFTPDGGLDYCNDVSNNFNNIVPGEYLCMKDTGYGHAGIYLGNGKVFECTVGWGAYKCIISDISTDGTRSYNGINNLRWTYHGKLDYIDYSDAPKPEPTPSDNKVNVYYRVKTTEYGWLPEVRNLEDYAGLPGTPITAVAVKVDRGSVWYQAHIKGEQWLPRVSGYDINEFYNGYAGDGEHIIDCVRIYYETPDDIRPYKKAKYRINQLPWVYDTERCPNGDDFAGNMGENAYRLEIIIE